MGKWSGFYCLLYDPVLTVEHRGQSHVNWASFSEHTFDLGQVLDGRSLVTSEAFAEL